MIRLAEHGDAAAMTALYNGYIRDGVATFEETEIGSDEMAGRLTTVRAAGLPWLVADAGDGLIGYAYAAPWRTRSAYRFAVESSVYLAPAVQGQGWGSALYTALLAQLRSAGIHCVIGGITLPNPASIALHEKFGYQQVARFPQVGYKFERWLDVGYWQLTFPDQD